MFVTCDIPMNIGSTRRTDRTSLTAKRKLVFSYARTATYYAGHTIRLVAWFSGCCICFPIRRDGTRKCRYSNLQRNYGVLVGSVSFGPLEKLFLSSYPPPQSHPWIIVLDTILKPHIESSVECRQTEIGRMFICILTRTQIRFLTPPLIKARVYGSPTRI